MTIQLTALPLPRPTDPVPTAILVGVDTHKHAHVAVAITALGARVAACRAPADREGYAALLASPGALLPGHVTQHARRAAGIAAAPLLNLCMTDSWIPVAREGIEPPTRGFSVPCSTN